MCEDVSSPFPAAESHAPPWNLNHSYGFSCQLHAKSPAQTCPLRSSPHKANSFLDTSTDTANATRPTRIQPPPPRTAPLLVFPVSECTAPSSVNSPSLKPVHQASHQAGAQLNNVCLLNDSLATLSSIVNMKDLGHFIHR